MAAAARLHEALRRLAAGDWEGAHALVQDDPSREAAWIHALLHRAKGELANARYWYGRAGRPEHRGSLEEERTAIQAALGGAEM